MGRVGSSCLTKLATDLKLIYTLALTVLKKGIRPNVFYGLMRNLTGGNTGPIGGTHTFLIISS